MTATGSKEILYPSYDGKLHAYWLDKTEHGNWPYTIPTSGASGDDFRFASEPIVVDLNNDGRSEVIFTSWPKKATGRVGQVHILDYQGAELHRIDLPAACHRRRPGTAASGAPTVANIDSDPDLELVVGTVASGVVAYKLPNTANARVLWRTGRGNYGRTGVALAVASAPPPDTTAPMAAITSPAGGAVVRASNSLTATAADNVGVVGVQFRLDGAALGAEDTAAPYSVPWNTTTASNGSHSLTAVARDAAGNVTTSAAVTVTVANGTTSTERIEEGNTAITYVGNWNHGNTSRPWSGGTASIGFAAGQRATLRFNGTGVSWIGFRAPWAGIANVYLDGTQVATVDAYAPAEALQTALFTASGLASGPQHLLTIEVPRTKNPLSVDYVVLVDAFDVMGAPPDTTPPDATITSPGGGETVSGTVPVTASAADEVGVAGVKFFVDGVQVGAEVTLIAVFRRLVHDAR